MTCQIATFLLGDLILGINILLVKEVYRGIDITPIPDAPPHLRGLMNLRGRVVTVFDLNVCLGRPSVEDITDSRLLILKTDDEISTSRNINRVENVKLGEDIVGFLIDHMDDVIETEEHDILLPPPNLDSVEEELIEGVIKRGEKLVILLNVSAILERVMKIAGDNTQK
jgi:purine-binding chemotaxis protein CheW